MAKLNGEICLIIVLCGILSLCNSECPTFGKPNKSTYSVWCTEECLNKKGVVYGTGVYSKGSSVCVAAVHAGVLFQQSAPKELAFKTAEKSDQFIGTMKNRIVSKSLKTTISEEAFQFASQKWIPEELHDGSWMADVVMVHNGYNQMFAKNVFFWIKCLWENQSTKDRSILRWNYEIMKTPQLKSKDYALIETSQFSNLRAFNCLGRYPMTDVFGVAVFSEDHFKTTNLTFRGVRDRPLMVNFTEKELTTKLDKVLMRRFPDGWEYDPKYFSNEGIQLLFQTLRETDAGLYAVGSNDLGKIDVVSSYFQVMVRECPEGRYGKNCAQTCKGCHNEGICHPLTGACICRPGTVGEKCEKICRLDHFGSLCQFNCTAKNLPVPDSKTNCRGLIFCLPNPYGCSCSFGYKGFFCDEYVALELPSFRDPPNVTLSDDGAVLVKCKEWDSNVDKGQTFSFDIDSYEVQLKEENGLIIYKQGVKISNGMAEYRIKSLQPERNYGIQVFIHLKEFKKTGRSYGDDVITANFSLPCFLPGDQVTNTSQDVNALEFWHKIPTKQVNFDGCTFLVKENSTYARIGHAKKCYNKTLSSWIFCKIEGLPSGQGLDIEIWCENSIGACQPQRFSTFTLPKISDYLSYSNYEIRITSFYVLDQETTELRFVKFKKGLNDSYLNTPNFETEDSDDNYQIIATKEDMTLDEEKKEYTLSLEMALKDEEPVRIAVILIYLNTGGEKLKSWRSFLSTDSIGESALLIPLLTVGILVLLLFLVFLLRKFRKEKCFAKKISSPVPHHRSSVLLTAENRERKETSEGKKTYFKVDFKEKVEYINTSCENSEELDIYLNKLIYSQESLSAFQSVPKDLGKSSSYGAHPMNKLKNRYKNNLPYDDTRVVLTKLNDDPYSDYINASFVKGKDSKKCYIATQGPKASNKSTLKDFWRMVIEMNVEIIVMVANFVESGKKKVDPYFNVNETMQIEDYSVRVTERLQKAHFIRSVIQVSDVSCKAVKRQVIHYQFTKWPDHGVPTQIFPLVTMIQSVSEEFKQGTIVIHCSAGLGRTGTVLMVLLLKEAYKLFTLIDPTETLRVMRECRAGLVDNINQYNLALCILYEDLFGHVGFINGSDLEENWNYHLQEAAVLYERLTRQPLIYSYAYGKNHISMNRNPSVLPCDSHAVLFGNEEYENNPDYLNAITIDIEDMFGSIIVTEHPMKSTVHNFWKMIFAKNCSHLFLLNDIQESQEYPSIIPLHKECMNYDGFRLKVTKLNILHAVLGQQYCVEITTEDSFHVLDVFQVKNWRQDYEYPTDISLVEEISCYILENATTQAPFVLCCRDGVTSCGLIACSVSVVNRIEVNQEVNIYNSVLRIRRYRPEFIVSKDQFEALYKVVLLYLQKNSIYQNFK